MPAEMAHKPMSYPFAVFNGHINDAEAKADAEFIRIYGQKVYDEQIKPAHDAGIMTLFHHTLTPEQMAWIAMVTVLVNEEYAK